MCAFVYGREVSGENIIVCNNYLALKPDISKY
jgi:hypothetical protein